MRYLVALLMLLVILGFTFGPPNMSMRVGCGSGGGSLQYQDLQDNTGTLLEDSSGQQLRSW